VDNEIITSVTKIIVYVHEGNVVHHSDKKLSIHNMI
jgi:hypothetical protein